jgi:hypothetical protein
MLCVGTRRAPLQRRGSSYELTHVLPCPSARDRLSLQSGERGAVFRHPELVSGSVFLARRSDWREEGRGEVAPFAAPEARVVARFTPAFCFLRSACPPSLWREESPPAEARCRKRRRWGEQSIVNDAEKMPAGSGFRCLPAGLNGGQAAVGDPFPSADGIGSS